MTFGEWLREYREKKGLLAREMAEMMGVTRVSVTNYEADRTCPSAEVMADLLWKLESIPEEEALEMHRRSVEARAPRKRGPKPRVVKILSWS